MLDWQVAIPSYRRAGLLTERTLPLLLDRGVSPERITVFLSDPGEADEYRAVVPEPVALVMGAPRLSGNRRAIQEHYPEGQALVCPDDDLKDLVRRLSEKDVEPVDNLAELFDEAFGLLDKTGLRLWGVYPVANPYFMRPRVTTDLRHIVGALWGCINTRTMHTSLEFKEDYERTLQFYAADGGVLRFNNVAVVTKFYGTGGLESIRSPDGVEAEVQILERRFPGLVHRNPRRKGPWPEILLRQSGTTGRGHGSGRRRPTATRSR